MRENRFSTASNAVGRPIVIAANGVSAPTQYATPMPCRNTVGRVSHCGGAVAACPLAASDKPTPASAMADNAAAERAETICQATRAAAIAAIAISIDGSRLVVAAAFHGADSSMAVERKTEQIETLKAQRSRRADQAEDQRGTDHV